MRNSNYIYTNIFRRVQSILKKYIQTKSIASNYLLLTCFNSTVFWLYRHMTESAVVYISASFLSLILYVVFVYICVCIQVPIYMYYVYGCLVHCLQVQLVLVKRRKQMHRQLMNMHLGIIYWLNLIDKCLHKRLQWGVYQLKCRSFRKYANIHANLTIHIYHLLL